MVVLNKGVSLIFILTNTFQCFLSLSASVFYLHHFYQYSLCLHGKNLVLLNLINKYVTSARELLLKSKGIVELCKAGFELEVCNSQFAIAFWLLANGLSHYFQKLRMVKTTFSLIQQFKLYLAHPSPPSSLETFSWSFVSMKMLKIHFY